MFDQSTAIGTDESNESTAPAWLRLHREMKAETRAQCSWDARRARHLREAEAHQLWNHFGYISILEYLEREHGIEPRAANDRLRVSLALAELPMLEAELEDGSFQYSHVKELTRVITPDTEEEWIQAARGKTCGEVQAMVSGRKKGDGPDDPDEPDLRLRRMVLEVPPQVLAMYRELQQEIGLELGHRLEDAELLRIILERAAACPDGASTPAQISICAHCKRGWQDGAGFRAELAAAEIATALCDGEHLGTVDGEPGRKTSTVSKRKRARILKRDRHRCSVPGCRSAKHLDVHHIVPREHGGGHEDGNLIALCSGHHGVHHAGRLAITGCAPAGIRFEWIHRFDDDGRANGRNAHVGTNAGAGHGHANVNTAGPARVVGSQAATVSARFDHAVMQKQARDGLVGLGWKAGIARVAVEEASEHLDEEPRIEHLIAEALRRCPKPLG